VLTFPAQPSELHARLDTLLLGIDGQVQQLRQARRKQGPEATQANSAS